MSQKKDRENSRVISIASQSELITIPGFNLNYIINKDLVRRKNGEFGENRKKAF